MTIPRIQLLSPNTVHKQVSAFIFEVSCIVSTAAASFGIQCSMHAPEIALAGLTYFHFCSDTYKSFLSIILLQLYKANYILV